MKPALMIISATIMIIGLVNLMGSDFSRCKFMDNRTSCPNITNHSEYQVNGLYYYLMWTFLIGGVSGVTIFSMPNLDQRKGARDK